MALKFALAGNPNCGKTTMFNALTGSNQYVGNWPGVTVEKKEGKMKGKFGSSDTIVTDLPGIYSLSPYTLEEVVSRDYILGENPDVIIDLVDATNIERNLYLTTQLIETGVPVVIALNMADLLKKRGIRVDTERLGSILGCKVVPTSALHGDGLDTLAKQAAETSAEKSHALPPEIFSKELESAVKNVDMILPASIPQQKRRWYAIKMLENDSKVSAQLSLSDSQLKVIAAERAAIEKKEDSDMESIVTDERYAFIQKVVKAAVKKSGEKLTTSDKIDQIVTSRIFGIPIFAGVMFLVYYLSINSMGGFFTDWINNVATPWVQEAVANGLTALHANSVLISAISDGVIGGLGAVLGFTPQMAFLFLFLSILEDCGYMVRIAFVMDWVFRHFGLSGKSFIPLLISSGCGVPGIMSSKTIDQDNDRRLTIMTATFIPCGAKLPVIALMGGIITSYSVTGNFSAGGWMAPMMYFVGIAAVLISAVMLKKTKPFSGKAAPFVMELPQYHIPQPKTVLMHVWERLKAFLKKAGTVLFIATLVMWFLSSFGMEGGHFGLVDNPNSSVLAAIGGAIAVIFRPLGFGEWQPVAASISGFTAKESIVSTMGVLAHVASDASEDTAVVGQAIASWFPSAAAAFSFLLFNLLDSPCLAAIGTMAAEMNDRKWFWFAILYQNVFAYVASLIVYQLWILRANGFTAWTAVAVVLLIIMLYLLFRPDPYKNTKTYSRRSVSEAV